MNIYIGYDSREDLAYQVCSHSIKSKSKSSDIYPLKLNDLKEKDLLVLFKFKFDRALGIRFV